MNKKHRQRVLGLARLLEKAGQDAMRRSDHYALVGDEVASTMAQETYRNLFAAAIRLHNYIQEEEENG